ncbi:MAG TPA: DoxX family protein [Candidatus Dormibacteraeota bacterium]|nr:DoxX family protein [Candidatus Dormibacteraeota bacterium]
MTFLEKFKPISLLLLRCALALIFMTHGYPKLFGQNPNGQPVIVPPSGSLVYLAGVVELFGGALMLLGLFTRAAALLLAVDMGLAVWNLVELGGYLATKQYELPLILCAASLALATVGPGIISIDHPLFSSGPQRKISKK